MNRAGWQHPRAAGVKAHQVRNTRPIDGEECVEHSGHEQGATRMRRLHFLIVRRIRFDSGPDAIRVDLSDGVAQRSAPTNGPPKLHGQTTQHRFRFQIAARLSNHVFKNL